MLYKGSFGFQPKLFRLAGKGGPLGELIQWTDTLCGLYMLGYDVKVVTLVKELKYVKIFMLQKYNKKVEQILTR